MVHQTHSLLIIEHSYVYRKVPDGTLEVNTATSGYTSVGLRSRFEIGPAREFTSDDKFALSYTP